MINCTNCITLFIVVSIVVVVMVIVVVVFAAVCCLQVAGKESFLHSVSEQEVKDSLSPHAGEVRDGGLKLVRYVCV